MRTIIDVLMAQPEFKALRGAIENSGWHDRQPVYSHSVKTHESLLVILGAAPHKVAEYLEQSVGTDSRRLLLEMAALLHDIGKKDVIEDRTGEAAQIGHESLGAARAEALLKKIGLAKEETDMICTVIINHSLIHHAIAPDNSNADADLKSMKQRHGKIFTELVLLGMADTMASDLASLKKGEYDHRMSSYRRILGKLGGADGGDMGIADRLRGSVRFEKSLVDGTVVEGIERSELERIAHDAGNMEARADSTAGWIRDFPLGSFGGAEMAGALRLKKEMLRSLDSRKGPKLV